ncbi:hypothetical protein BC830DRAFT_1152626, partial [Chytriomyces sp. MP71]
MLCRRDKNRTRFSAACLNSKSDKQIHKFFFIRVIVCIDIVVSLRWKITICPNVHRAGQAISLSKPGLLIGGTGSLPPEGSTHCSEAQQVSGSECHRATDSRGPAHPPFSASFQCRLRRVCSVRETSQAPIHVRVAVRVFQRLFSTAILSLCKSKRENGTRKRRKRV